MPLDQPPIPVTRRKEFPFQSQVFPDITYILKPCGRENVASMITTQRMIAALKRPITEKLRDMMLELDLKPFMSPAEVSRTVEVVHALQAGARGIKDEDLLFIDQYVEPLLMRHVPEFKALVVKSEDLSYERRMWDLAEVLAAVEEKGDRYTFPPDSIEARFEYIRDYVDTLDINHLYVRSRNLQEMAPDEAKNSEPPSTSD